MLNSCDVAYWKSIANVRNSENLTNYYSLIVKNRTKYISNRRFRVLSYDDLSFSYYLCVI